MSDPSTVTAGPQSPLVDSQHPWLGLLPFKEEHSRFFFGRDAEIAEILGRIRENTLTILFGQSGLGKTSLLGAAVVPKLAGATFAPVLLRLDFAPGAPSLIEQTRDAFRRAMPAIPWPDDAPAITLWELFHRLPGLLSADSPAPVLIIDQFEEIFTLGRQDPAHEREGEQWLEQMADLVQNRPPRTLEERFAGNRRLARDYDFSPSPLRIVFALREDYLSQLEGWKTRLPLLTQNRMALLLLNGPQALEAVLGPGSLGEYPLVSREVAASIVRTVARAAPGTPLPQIKAVPPLLSLLCEQLNAARLAAGAAGITAGMVTSQSEDILQRFYVESFAAFPQQHREIIRALIEDPPMITEGGYRNALVREDAEAHLSRLGVPGSRAVFDTLIQRRLITVEEKGRVQRLEVTHDVLVPLLVRSRKERRDRVAKELAERKLAEEAAKTRKRRIFTIAAVALMLIAIAGAIYGWWSAREATAQRDEARYNEGLGWMLRAQVAEERKDQYPGTLIFAAQAIGFDGVGRPDKAPDDLLRFIRQERNPEDYAAARKWIADRPAYLPVWASAERPAEAKGLSLSSDGRRLALSLTDGSVQFWDFRDGNETTVLPPGTAIVEDIAFHPNGQSLAIATDKAIRYWDLEKAAFTEEVQDSVSRLAWSPGGSILGGAGKDGSIHILQYGASTSVPTGFGQPAASLSYSADNSALAAAFPGFGIRLVFPRYAELASAWGQLTEQHAEAVDEQERPDFIAMARLASRTSALAIRPDGQVLAAGASDGTISVWDTTTAKLVGQASQEQRHLAAVTSLAFRPDGRQFASASADHTIRLWSISGEQVPVVIATLIGHRGAVTAVQYAPGGDVLASAGAHGSARLWNVSDHKAGSPDLYTYLDQHWYRLDAASSQTLQWAGGTGFANVPAGSLAGIWQAGGTRAFTRLLNAGEWNGAATVSTTAKEKEKDLAAALLADAQDAAKNHRWNRVDLRLGQLEALGTALDSVDLWRRRDAISKEGEPFKNATGLDMLWCPTGTFEMGSPEKEKDRYSYETQHKVTLSHGYWLSKFELTQKQWAAIMGSNRSTYKADANTQGELPMENISWYEAVDFCRRLTDRERASGTIPPGWEYALPTEAQWEYACRADTKTAYSFADDVAQLHRYGNFNDKSGNFRGADLTQDDGFQFTAPVGTYQPNAWKFYDMHGNVWEWCMDSLDPANPDYGPADVVDPLGTAGTHRVVRGGGFDGTAGICRAALRGANLPSLRDGGLGLRPALVPSRTGSWNSDSAVAEEGRSKR